MRSRRQSADARPVSSNRGIWWILIGTICFGVNLPGADDNDVLGPADQIAIHSIQAKEIADKQFRIESGGDVNLPLAGRVHLAGLTIKQAEDSISKVIGKYYLEPDISVTVVEFHSETVSVIGAVGNPGVHQARGHKTLLEVLSMAGGVKPDAGPILTMTRQIQYGPLPLPGARETGSHTLVADVDLKSLLAAKNPAENIYVEPYDVIAIPRAEMIYVIGNVKKGGSISLGGRSTISALEALALAEGLDPRAAASHARILRFSNGGVDASREQIPINLSKILTGKQDDILLHPNDILFVPNSTAKQISARSVEVALQIATGIVIFHK